MLLSFSWLLGAHRGPYHISYFLEVSDPDTGGLSNGSQNADERGERPSGPGGLRCDLPASCSLDGHLKPTSYKVVINYGDIIDLN